MFIMICAFDILQCHQAWGLLPSWHSRYGYGRLLTIYCLLLFGTFLLLLHHLQLVCLITIFEYVHQILVFFTDMDVVALVLESYNELELLESAKLLVSFKGQLFLLFCLQLIKFSHGLAPFRNCRIIGPTAVNIIHELWLRQIKMLELYLRIGLKSLFGHREQNRILFLDSLSLQVLNLSFHDLFLYIIV